MTDSPKKASNLEEILFQLLEVQSKQGLDYNSLLVLLSLVNLLGIINLLTGKISVRTGIDNTGTNQLEGPLGKLASGESEIITSLLSSMGGKKIDPAVLMGMINSIMGSSSASTAGSKSTPGDEKAEVMGKK